jgi:hypothetical protein
MRSLDFGDQEENRNGNSNDRRACVRPSPVLASDLKRPSCVSSSRAAGCGIDSSLSPTERLVEANGLGQLLVDQPQTSVSASDIARVVDGRTVS